jgi:hypothetical protein
MVAAVREAPPVPLNADSEYDDSSECYAQSSCCSGYKFPRCKLQSGFWLTSAWFVAAACLGPVLALRLLTAAIKHATFSARDQAALHLKPLNFFAGTTIRVCVLLLECTNLGLL